MGREAPVTIALFDTHCHLQDPRLDEIRDALLERARAVGVTHLVCCGTREGDWGPVLDLARNRAEILPMLGLHPWYVREAAPSWRSELERLARTDRIGIGECGLDFAIEDADPALQESAFRAQLAMARDLDIPVSIHCRKAWERLLAVAREVGLPPAGAVVHAYSGSPETARELQEVGFHLAFGCSLTNPANHRSSRSLLAVSPDRLLFETDAPDIPPRHLPDYTDGRPNEPANLALVLEAAARILDRDPEALAAQVHANSTRFFGRLRP